MRALVAETVANLGAKGPQDVRRIMGALMPKVRSRVDGARVAELVREALEAGS